ncbi:MAG: quinolinate synthase NadA [Bacteroidales bacterium]|nr:quinolinate synthase NadA [Bacteroidales bacterium]
MPGDGGKRPQKRTKQPKEMVSKEDLLLLKQQKNALVLAHYYTLPEVQEVADFVGDSLGLSQKAAQTDADIILFAGVHFMAETAKILNPGKKVLVPDMDAGCSLADGCAAEDLKEFMRDYPGYKVLAYINCSAEVKTMADIIVTSGNALHIVNALPKDEKIVFVPDRNLGDYINRQTGRQMVLWHGDCCVHARWNAAMVRRLKEAHPQAAVVAHPECRREVLELADFVGSTAAMLNHVQSSEKNEFVVITENGILHEMRKRNPGKTFYSADDEKACICRSMKKNNLENMYRVLADERPELLLDEETIAKARLPIQRMLSMSQSLRRG